MNHALRVLREELWWLTHARRKALAEMVARRAPPELSIRYAAEITDEIREIMEAIMALDPLSPEMLADGPLYMGLAPDPQLPFVYDDAGRKKFLIAGRSKEPVDAH